MPKTYFFQLVGGLKISGVLPPVGYFTGIALMIPYVAKRHVLKMDCMGPQSKV